MAFQQPARPPQPRVVRVEPPDWLPALAPENSVLASQVRLGPDESRTWVLFSPATDAGSTTSYLSASEAADDQPTPGRPRLSDLESLHSIARSDLPSSSLPSNAFEESVVATEEDAELDSLDSHLPEFRSAPNPYSRESQQRQPQQAHAAPVLPGHDGLGSFRFDTQALCGTEAQDQIFAFERFNSRRVKRRKESVGLQLEHVQEMERNQRIEAWRLDQSQILLDEFKKDTRRTQYHVLSLKTSSQLANLPQEDDAARDIPFTAGDWHEQDDPDHAPRRKSEWSRITRRFIRNLMGIDDAMLSILFGQAAPDDDGLSSAPKVSALPTLGAAPATTAGQDSPWQQQMLSRIARELDLLMQTMTTHHPGAFSTYPRVPQTCGLPAIPESGIDLPEQLDGRTDTQSAFSMPPFRPTVAQPTDVFRARIVSIAKVTSQAPDPVAQMTFTPQEWEQDLDSKLVFRYLRSRFTSLRFSWSSPLFTGGTAHLATSSTQDAAAKAARVRQHHPLVRGHQLHNQFGGLRARHLKGSAAQASSASVVAAALRVQHPGGARAIQSGRRSARQSNVSLRTRSHTSKHYWDKGGSTRGTGSMIASAASIGSWGDALAGKAS